MKKLLTLVFFLCTLFFANAQTDGITYQAVIIDPENLELPGVDSEGNYLPNTTIAIRFTIYDSGNQIEFQEIQITETDDFGRINLLIGEAEHDYFKEISWDGTPKDLKVEIDFEAGSNFEEMSREALTFLPYAYHRNITATGTLTVDDKTFLNGEMEVQGPTNLYSTLTVHDTNPTLLTGTLDVDGDTNLNGALNVNNTSPTDLSGTLNVDGDASLNSDLDVLNGLTTLNDLNVNGLASFGDLNAENLTVQFSTELNGSLDVTSDEQVSIVSNLGAGDDDDINNYPLLVEGAKQGIAIKIRTDRKNENNFISFWDSDEDGANPEMWGRIEGEIESEFINNADYRFDKDLLNYDKISGIIDAIFALNDIAVATGNLIASNSSTTGCAGIGACVTTPVLSFIINAGVQLTLAIIQEAAVLAYLIVAIDNENTYDANKITYQGVTYASGAGDYAEYLRKIDNNEDLNFGDIVGVYGGQVTKNTSKANRVMVVSRKPIVLGAMPEVGTEQDYAKIAFMGQVPVKVFGRVNIGDYIIPSGNNDGVGIAISPLQVDLSNVKKIVGVAWENSVTDHGLTKINVAVGLNTNDNNPIVEKLQNKVVNQDLKIKNLESQIREIKDLIVKINSTTNNTIEEHHDDKDYEIVNGADYDVIYFEIADKHIEQSFKRAKEILLANNTFDKSAPFWDKLENDPYFKKMIIDKIKSKIESEFHYHKELNSEGKH